MQTYIIHTYSDSHNGMFFDLIIYDDADKYRFDESGTKSYFLRQCDDSHKKSVPGQCIAYFLTTWKFSDKYIRNPLK